MATLPRAGAWPPPPRRPRWRPPTTCARCSGTCGTGWRRRGRDPFEVDVSFGTDAGGQPGTQGFDPEATLDALGELAALGVTWAEVAVPGDSLTAALEALEQYGETVIAAIAPWPARGPSDVPHRDPHRRARRGPRERGDPEGLEGLDELQNIAP